ncbi:MAG: phenylalanine--tRNA ligase subunit alpha [Spirochaetota bacterium]|nr:phenylalanine--tRNA ligase subunit alpha [Spirochaetota bacterium]
MKNELNALKNEAIDYIPKVKSESELDQVRVDFLGKKGKLTKILKSLGSLSANERPLVGQLSNEIKQFITEQINKKKEEFRVAAQSESIRKESIDISLPGRQPSIGYLHPITQVIQEITHIFKRLGFQVAEGPELEEEYYNFDALNLPKNHPARDEQDSFYITSDKLLRTQTSPVQIRVMEKQRPPIAIISPGRCFRRDAMDATHSHTFHQIEGLAVDKDISFADLKGILHLFAKQMFGSSTQTRFRPDFFPFTEPSGEFAITCFICHGKKCRVCKGTGWIELGGCGLVDPAVFGFVNIDPEEYSGYAFGMGIERLAMAKYGVPDIRMFYENDIRFLEQF